MKPVTGVELAEVLKVSKQAVYQATRKGRIFRLPNGKYDLEQAVTDWERQTHSRWGGKRIPRVHESSGYSLHNERGSNPLKNPLHIERSFNPPEVEFWLKMVEQAYPMVALDLGRHWNLTPAKVWKLLGSLFYFESRAVMTVLSYPEDASLDEVFAYTPFANKLREHPYSQKLRRWLVKELKKDEWDELDPPIWE